MESLKVVLEYRRSKPAWVCLECDTENDCMRNNCLFCGCNRTGNEWIIEPWKPTPEPVMRETTTNVTGRTYAPGYSSTSRPTAGTNPVPMTPPKDNSALVGLVAGIAVLFLILLVVILVNA